MSGPTNAYKRKQILARNERDKKIIALVRAGATLVQICETMGYSDVSYASRAWKAAVQRCGPPDTDKKWARAKHLDRLEGLFRTAWAKAIGDEARGIAPDPKWLDIARKLLVDIAEFQGTNAPKEVRVGGSKTAGPIQVAAVDYGDLTEMSDEQLTEVRRALAEASRALTSAAQAAGGGSGDGETEEGEPGED